MDIGAEVDALLPIALEATVATVDRTITKMYVTVLLVTVVDSHVNWVRGLSTRAVVGVLKPITSRCASHSAARKERSQNKFRQSTRLEQRSPCRLRLGRVCILREISILPSPDPAKPQHIP